MALTKIDDRGLKTPIDLLDNEKIRFGTGNDLEIYHSGSDSRIVESGPGSLYLGGSRVEIVNPAISELMVQCIENGSSELYYDGSKKFETLSTGWGVANTIEWHSTQGSLDLYDNKKVSFGGSRDLQIYHNGSNSYISNTHASSFYIQSNGNLLLEHTNGENYVKGNANGAVELYYDDSKKFETTSTGATVTGTLLVGTTTSSSVGGFGAGSLQLLGTSTTASASFINNENNTNVHAITLGKIRTGGANSGLVNDGDELGRIVWQGYDGSAYRMSSEIYGEVDGTPGSSDMPGRLIFSTTADGATSPTERMRITSEGNIGINETSPSFSEFGSNGGGLELDDVNTGFTAVKVSQSSTHLYLVAHSSGAYLSTRSNQALVFETNSTAALTLSASQNATFTGTVSDSIGNLRSIPQNAQTSAYVITASDAGKHIRTDSNVTLNNSTLSVGDAVTIVNYGSSDITITQGSGVSLHLAGNGTGNQGDRTLVATGVCTILYVGNSQYFASGAGLS